MDVKEGLVLIRLIMLLLLRLFRQLLSVNFVFRDALGLLLASVMLLTLFVDVWETLVGEEKVFGFYRVGLILNRVVPCFLLIENIIIDTLAIRIHFVFIFHFLIIVMLPTLLNLLLLLLNDSFESVDLFIQRLCLFQFLQIQLLDSFFSIIDQFKAFQEVITQVGQSSRHDSYNLLQIVQVAGHALLQVLYLLLLVWYIGAAVECRFRIFILTLVFEWVTHVFFFDVLDLLFLLDQDWEI